MDEDFFIPKTKRAESSQQLIRPKKRGSINRPQQRGIMIIKIYAKLKDIYEKGREYPWEKPKTCPNCNNFNIWGHGFVTAFFDGFDQSLYIRRYRCPDCTCVIRMRPSEFFSRFQAPIETIRSSISTRKNKGTWLPDICRSRQYHWYRALKRRTVAYLGNTTQISSCDAFDYFVAKGIAPVSRSI